MGTYLVSYADTDAGGVMHHARYVELAERDRHVWLKLCNLPFSKISEKYGLSLVVHNIAAKYKQPLFLEDEVNIHTYLNSVDRSGLVWTTYVNKEHNTVCKLTTRMVCVDINTKSIVSVPTSLISELNQDSETKAA